MKVSLNWIKDYVKLPEDMDLTRLAYDLTMSTVEVEGATDLARQFDHIDVYKRQGPCRGPPANRCPCSPGRDGWGGSSDCRSRRARW